MGNKYCADCVSMQENGHTKGKFLCTNSRSGYDKVSARMIACSSFTECFNSRRGESDRERLMSISRSYNCYIIGAIVRTLDLEDGTEYLETFDYYREVMLPRINGGIEWLEDYDSFGPLVALEIEGDIEKCNYLLSTYINPFMNYILANQLDEAIKLYNHMYDSLKEEYAIGTHQRKNLKTTSII